MNWACSLACMGEQPLSYLRAASKSLAKLLRLCNIIDLQPNWVAVAAERLLAVNQDAPQDRISSEFRTPCELCWSSQHLLLSLAWIDVQGVSILEAAALW